MPEESVRLNDVDTSCARTRSASDYDDDDAADDDGRTFVISLIFADYGGTCFIAQAALVNKISGNCNYLVALCNNNNM